MFSFLYMETNNIINLEILSILKEKLWSQGSLDSAYYKADAVTFKAKILPICSLSLFTGQVCC